MMIGPARAVADPRGGKAARAYWARRELSRIALPQGRTGSRAQWILGGNRRGVCSGLKLRNQITVAFAHGVALAPYGFDYAGRSGQRQFSSEFANKNINNFDLRFIHSAI